MESIKAILMRRDRMTEEDADDLIAQARADLDQRLEERLDAYDICEEWFGLDPDHLMELVEECY